jgi:uncharacterized membrane protein (DUF373 family)
MSMAGFFFSFFIGVTMKTLFRAFVIASAVGLFGILMSAVLVDYQVISRMYFDLVLVATLFVAVLGMSVGFFLEIVE